MIFSLNTINSHYIYIYILCSSVTEHVHLTEHLLKGDDWLLVRTTGGIPPDKS